VGGGGVGSRENKGGKEWITSRLEPTKKEIMKKMRRKAKRFGKERLPREKATKKKKPRAWGTKKWISKTREEGGQEKQKELIKRGRNGHQRSGAGVQRPLKKRTAQLSRGRTSTINTSGHLGKKGRTPSSVRMKGGSYQAKEYKNGAGLSSCHQSGKKYRCENQHTKGLRDERRAGKKLSGKVTGDL